MLMFLNYDDFSTTFFFFLRMNAKETDREDRDFKAFPEDLCSVHLSTPRPSFLKAVSISEYFIIIITCLFFFRNKIMASAIFKCN